MHSKRGRVSATEMVVNVNDTRGNGQRKTHIGNGVFCFEVPQNFVTEFGFSGVLVGDHAFGPEDKEFFVVIADTVKFTVGGSTSDKQSESLCLIGNFRNIAISMAVFLELAKEVSPGNRTTLESLGWVG
jgi:hypothetical protein